MDPDPPEQHVNPAPAEAEKVHGLAQFGEIKTLDAAKVALKWAEGRLASVEDQARDIRAQADTQLAVLNLKEKDVEALRRALEERQRQLHDQEDFYLKLNSTLKAFVDGKMDVNILIQKQMELDALQKRLIEEHHRRLLDLERSQQQIQDRWHERLLELEGQYSKRLNEARKAFEMVRQEEDRENLEYQRGLEKSYQEKYQQLESIKGDLLDDHAKRLAEMEAGFAKRRADMEQDIMALKAELHNQYEAPHKALEKGSLERLKMAEAAFQEEKRRIGDEVRRLERDKQALEAQLFEMRHHATARLEADYRQELIAKTSEMDAQYRQKVDEMRRQSHVLEAEHSRRERELQEFNSQQIKKLEEQVFAAEERLRAEVDQLRAHHEKQKEFLTEQIQAALSAGQDLARQYHDFQQQSLREAAEKEAAWSQSFDNLRRGKEGEIQKWQAKAESLDSEHEERLRKLRLAQEAKLAEIRDRLELEQEEFRKEQEERASEIVGDREAFRKSLVDQYANHIESIEGELLAKTERLKTMETRISELQKDNIGLRKDKERQEVELWNLCHEVEDLKSKLPPQPPAGAGVGPKTEDTSSAGSIKKWLHPFKFSA